MYNEFFTITNFREKLLPRLSDTHVCCALCGRSFPRLWASHLKSHADFLEPQRKLKRIRKPEKLVELEQQEHPDGPVDPWMERQETLSETYARLFGPTSLINALVEKTLELYAPSRMEWTLMEQLENKAEWFTITPESTGWPCNRLTREALKKHFRGRHTVGVKSRFKSKTKVVVFDVDAVPQWGESAADAQMRAKQVVRALVKVMKRHQLEPHVSASGGKGYHVSLFFDEMISHTMARNLFVYFTNHPDVSMDRVSVECLPLTKAIKLPLGIHWEAKTFCGFVDAFTLTPLTDPYRYYLQIRPIPRKLLDQFEAERKALKARKRKIRMDDSWSAAATEMAFKLGIEARGTRHNTTLRAAAYAVNHLKPGSYDELLEILVDWSQKQYQLNGANIRTRWFAHLKDLDHIAKYVWEHRFTGGIQASVDFTAGDVHWIRSKTPNLAAQRLLLAALYQYRMVGGYFYFGFARMQQLTGMAKDSLVDAIRELRDERGVLKIVENYSHQTGLRKSKTNQYTLTEVPGTQDIDTVLATITSGTWTVDLWYRLLLKLFTRQQLKKAYPFSYHRILAVIENKRIAG
ncbi:TOTE conflict system archaeo-eukaryotic primase domain-containing protein [Effusibacillus pohliae]|uniref:TOTE conflict system archaeo-eukaryotic primase domain-containing protein n=1 Tax=Effusibacillus pohliae TaxID=232270 RepID=UPI000380B587|nr:hypothetical protein [Effusibacillus pohliae]